MKVGFLGTGLMGAPMAARIAQAGIPLAAYNRTRSRAEPLREVGATIADHPSEVIAAAGCIIVMVTDAAAVREVLLSEAARQHLAGRTIIQMSTISPTESRQLQHEVSTAGADYLEAPVLGSIPEATAGTLIIMVGSTTVQFQRWQPLLQHLGPEPLHLGEVGSAAAAKLAMNQLIGALTAAFASSLAFVIRQGVNVESFMQIVRSSALYAPTFDKKLQRMVEQNFANPNFPTRHLLKDICLFVEEARANDLATASVEGVRQMLESAITAGHADGDYSALFAALFAPSAAAGNSSNEG